MVRSNQPASSNWTVVPTTFRVVWNDVDPDEMFRPARPTPPRRVRAALRRVRLTLSRARAALSAATDCVLVSAFVTLVMGRDRLRRMLSMITHNKPRTYLLTSRKLTQPTGEWHFGGSMNSATTNVSFLCIIRKDEGTLVCG